MFILGDKPVDVQGNTYIGYLGKNWYFSVPMTKEEAAIYKSFGQLPLHVVARFEKFWRDNHAFLPASNRTE